MTIFKKSLVNLVIVSSLCNMSSYGMFLESYQKDLLFSKQTMDNGMFENSNDFFSQQQNDKIFYEQFNTIFNTNKDEDNNYQKELPDDELIADNIYNKIVQPNNDNNNINNPQPNNINNLLNATYNEMDVDNVKNYSGEINTIAPPISYDLFVDEKVNKFIQNLMNNDILFMDDNILQGARNIFQSVYEINKLLYKYNEMNLIDMEKTLDKSPNIIDPHNILWHTMKLSNNDSLLYQFTLQCKEFNHKFKNVELLICKNNQEILVGSIMKQNVLLDRIIYTFTQSNSIALLNFLNLIWLTNNTNSRKFLLLNIFNNLFDNIPNIEIINHNKAQFLSNFKYYIKYINQNVKDKIKQYIQNSNNKTNSILDDILKILNNNSIFNDVPNELDVMCNCIFPNKLQNINCNVLISNKQIIANVLNDNYIPMQYKINILNYLLNTSITSNDYLVFNEFVPLFSDQNIFLLHNIISNACSKKNELTEKYKSLQLYINDIILNNTLKNKQYITELFKIFEKDNYSQNTQSVIDNIIYKLIITSNEESLRNVLENSNDTVDKLFMNTIEKILENNNLDSNLKQKVEELQNKINILINNKFIKNKLNNSDSFNIYEICSLFNYAAHVKALVEFLNVNYNSKYSEIMISNIIYFATINNVISNTSKYNQNFKNNFLHKININVLKSFDNLIKQHIKNINKETEKILYMRHKELRDCIGKYINVV